jgi:hypothetical protein
MEALALLDRRPRPPSDKLRELRKRNPELTYMAARFLRGKGHKVRVFQRDPYGRETHHEIDGQIHPTSWMVDMAKAEGWKPDFATPLSIGGGRRGQ